ncbi:PREDICTED: multiple epidermal growth factor-like domains protein 11, partial [Nicrophorus vespilloides]|uniref:Multiple epidermal growth factor-like domains protein 11 n=1 Tax=Nicrophorus vespilloides TaxID=110193 RepID=A0ABM1MVP4_NICVS
SNCSIDKFGNDCIECKSVFNTDICEETLTCVETNKCYCQPGYYGKHCKPKCDNLKANVFGSNCNEKCGNCKNKAQCHHITGNCPNGCEMYFVEPFCNETNLPYLKETPVAETPCYTTCNIKFNPEKYVGRNSPDSYKVE